MTRLATLLYTLAAALGCLSVSAVISTAPAQARLDKGVAQAAGNKYSTANIVVLNTYKPIHAMTAGPLQTHLFRASGTSFRYFEKWSFADDKTGKFAYYCWLRITLRGDSSRVKVKLIHNSASCGGIPRADYFPASGTLRYALPYAARAAAAQAKLTKDTARSASNAYSLRAVSDVSNNTGVHNATAAPLKTRLIRKSSNSYRYWERWDFVQDSTNKFSYTCWMYIILRGDSSKVSITLQKNSLRCKGMPQRATFYPGSNLLVPNS
jgi:hypothetical protein